MPARHGLQGSHGVAAVMVLLFDRTFLAGTFRRAAYLDAAVYWSRRDVAIVAGVALRRAANGIRGLPLRCSTASLVGHAGQGVALISEAVRLAVAFVDSL